MSDKPECCPFCGDPIWGEGWNPSTGETYFSHRFSGMNKLCAQELGRMPDGKWSQP